MRIVTIHWACDLSLNQFRLAVGRASAHVMTPRQLHRLQHVDRMWWGLRGNIGFHGPFKPWHAVRQH